VQEAAQASNVVWELRNPRAIMAQRRALSWTALTKKLAVLKDTQKTLHLMDRHKPSSRSALPHTRETHVYTNLKLSKDRTQRCIDLSIITSEFFGS
jgi:hypothetical protein